MVRVDHPGNSSRGRSIIQIQAVTVMHPGNSSRGRSSIQKIHRMMMIVYQVIQAGEGQGKSSAGEGCPS
eukprot:5582048-Karenia_brevis.AAC.1